MSVTVALEKLTPLLHKNTSMVDFAVKEKLESKVRHTLVVGFMLTTGQWSVQNGSDVAILHSSSDRSCSCETRLTRCLPTLSSVEGPDPIHKMLLPFSVPDSGGNREKTG